MVDALAHLIDALAALAWPLVVLYLVHRFTPDIRDVLGRLRKGKVAGAELELSERLDQLVTSTGAAASDLSALAQGDMREAPQEQTAEEDAAERTILSEVARSPKAGLLLLSVELEKSLRHLLAAHGVTKRPVPFHQGVEKLAGDGILPRSVVESLQRFRDVRNQLVHGQEASDDEVIRAVDAGLMLLRSIQSAPQQVATVKHTQIPLYSDVSGRIPLNEVSGLLLEVQSWGSLVKEERIVPTRRADLQVGRRVGWKYSYERDYRDTWYRHPEEGDIRHAWSYSKEFIGGYIEEM